MDPVAVLAGVAQAALIIDAILTSYNDATGTLYQVRMQIRILETGVRQICTWIEQNDVSSRRNVMDALRSAVETINFSIERLREDLQHLQGRNTMTDKLMNPNMWVKSKFVWSEQIIRKHLTDLRECTTLVQFTLNVCQLPVSESSTREANELEMGARTLNRAHKSVKKNRTSAIMAAEVKNKEEHSQDFNNFLQTILQTEQEYENEKGEPSFQAPARTDSSLEEAAMASDGAHEGFYAQQRSGSSSHQLPYPTTPPYNAGEPYSNAAAAATTAAAASTASGYPTDKKFSSLDTAFARSRSLHGNDFPEGLNSSSSSQQPYSQQTPSADNTLPLRLTRSPPSASGVPERKPVRPPKVDGANNPGQANVESINIHSSTSSPPPHNPSISSVNSDMNTLTTTPSGQTSPPLTMTATGGVDYMSAGQSRSKSDVGYPTKVATPPVGPPATTPSEKGRSDWGNVPSTDAGASTSNVPATNPFPADQKAGAVYMDPQRSGGSVDQAQPQPPPAYSGPPVAPQGASPSLAAHGRTPSMNKQLPDPSSSYVNSAPPSGCPDIVQAAQIGIVDVVRNLVAQQVDIDATDLATGHTALMAAALAGHSQICAMLVQSGCRIDKTDIFGDTALHLAAKGGNPDVLKLMLMSNKIGVNTRGQNGATVLHLSAEQSNPALTTMVIRHMADVNVKDSSQQTALHHAAKQGSVEICEMLIDKGCFVDDLDSTGQTALQLAAAGNHPDAVTLLLNRSRTKEANNSAIIQAFLEAVRFGNVRMAENFLDRRLIRRQKFPDSWKPIAYAAQSGRIPMLDLMLNNKFNLKDTSPDNWTPLHFAAYYGERVMAETLLKRGVSWKKHTKRRKETALHLAIAQGHTDTALMLIAHKGASLETTDAEDQEPLHIAVRCGAPPVVTALLSKGVRAKELTKYGWRPVHIAAAYGRTAVLAELISRGANLEEKTEKSELKQNKQTYEAVRSGCSAEARWPHPGVRPLHLALEFGHDELAQMLWQRGVKVDERDSMGWRPLHHAAFACRPAMVDLLLQRGASPHSKTNDGQTPYSLGFRAFGLDHASEQDKERVRDLLMTALARTRKTKIQQWTSGISYGANTHGQRNQAWHTALLTEQHMAAETAGATGEDDARSTTTEERTMSESTGTLGSPPAWIGTNTNTVNPQQPLPERGGLFMPQQPRQSPVSQLYIGSSISGMPHGNEPPPQWAMQGAGSVPQQQSQSQPSQTQLQSQGTIRGHSSSFSADTIGQQYHQQVQAQQEAQRHASIPQGVAELPPTAGYTTYAGPGGPNLPPPVAPSSSPGHVPRGASGPVMGTGMTFAPVELPETGTRSTVDDKKNAVELAS